MFNWNGVDGELMCLLLSSKRVDSERRIAQLLEFEATLQLKEKVSRYGFEFVRIFRSGDVSFNILLSKWKTQVGNRVDRQRQ